MKHSKSLRSVVEVAALEARRLFSVNADLGGLSSIRAPGTDNRLDIPIPSDSVASGGINTLSVPAYSSRPGANPKLYIDFNGHGAIDNWGGWWEFGGRSVTETPAYDIDGDSNSWTTAELANIQTIWKIAAEKFSPFDIDVTTVEPPVINGVRMVIGGDGAWRGKGGGIARRNGWGFDHGVTASLNSANVAFVWNGQYQGGEGYIGETIAHEAGHTLGLAHLSHLPLSKMTEYAPNLIMGSGSTSPIGRWASTATSGTTSSSVDGDDFTNEGSQDDLAEIVSGHGFGYRPDDVGGIGGTGGNATFLPMTLQSGVLEGAAEGVISREFDLDVFRIDHTGGSLHIEVLPAEFRGMLDPFLALRNTSNVNIAVSTTDTGGQGVGEILHFNTLAAATYYIAIGGGGTYGDMGQYRLNVSGGLDATASNNTVATATRLGTFGQTDPVSVAAGFAGTTTFTDTLTAADQYDFFRIRAPRNARHLHVQMSNQTTSVSLALYDDINANGVIEVGEILYATNPSMQFHSHTYTGVVPNKFYYVRAGRATAAGAGTYVLNISADTAPATLAASTPFASFDPQPLIGGRNIYDSIHTPSGDIVDYYRVTAQQSGLFAFNLVNSGEGDLRLDVGTDTNANGTLEAGEILASSATAGTGNEFIQNLAVAADQKVLVRVTPQVLNANANYRLFAIADYSIGANLSGALTGAQNLTALSAGSIYEFLDPSGNLDNYDTFRIAPQIGQMEARLHPIDPSAVHRLEIIRDGNNNGVVDAGEIVASGVNTQLTYNVIPGGTYYLRASIFVSGEFFSAGNYRIGYASAGAVTGSTLAAPSNIVVTNTTLAVGGFLGFDSADASLTNTTDYYRLTLNTRTRFDVSIVGEGMGVQVGILDGDGNFQRIGGVSMAEEPVNALNVNLDPGTYLVRAFLPFPEELDDGTTAGGSYGLAYKTNAITDNSPPVVIASAFQYEIGATGVSFTMDQDVAGSVNLADATIRSLADNSLYALGTTFYDQTTRRIGFTVGGTGVLPDGNYRATLLAGSVKDASANPLAASYTFDFFVFAGDANRDRTVDIADFSTIATRFNQPGTFSQGDFNYDHVADIGDFSILASKFNTSLPALRSISSTGTARVLGVLPRDPVVNDRATSAPKSAGAGIAMFSSRRLADEVLSTSAVD